MPFDDFQPTPGGSFDFHPVFPSGAAVAPVDTSKRPRSIPEEKVNPRPIDILDFMDQIQHSPDMIVFSQPFSAQLNWLRSEWLRLKNLPRYDRCDERYLPHLAANFGFELIDIQFATSIERRSLIRDVIPILRRRGTLWSVRRIIEALGFSVTFAADYQISGRFNKHKFWSRMAVTSQEYAFNWDDGTMQGWSNESLGNFKSVAQSLRGSSLTGTSAPTMSATFPETTSDYNLQFDYRLLSTGNCWFGTIARYESASKALLVTFFKNGATEQLSVYYYSGVWVALSTVDISALSWRTGTHRLTIWDTGAKITVILDDTTLMYEVDYFASVAANKKGLFAAFGTEVEFDNYFLRILDRRKQPKFFAEGQADKTLTITLSGTPQFETAKREYLAKIIPEFVPMDVAVVWA